MLLVSVFFQIKVYYAALSGVWEFKSILTTPLATFFGHELAESIPSGNVFENIESFQERIICLSIQVIESVDSICRDSTDTQ